MTDFSAKTDAQIDTWIENHEDKCVTQTPLYHGLLEERARRGEEKSNLKIDRSIVLLRRAAIEHRCVSYGDIAKESGVEWNKARHRMNGRRGHLEQLLDVCHVRNLPMLPALCVNKAGVVDGELGEGALSGFCDGLRRLGHPISDDPIEERATHHHHRDTCWEWGRDEATGRV